MEETTAAVVRIESMLTAAVLLALGLVRNVTGYGLEGSRRVRLEVECEAAQEREVRELAERCEHGLRGIMVDVGKYQEAYRTVSRIIDDVREGASRKGC